MTHGSSSSSPMAPTAPTECRWVNNVGQKSPEKMICILHPSSNFWEGGHTGAGDGWYTMHHLQSMWSCDAQKKPKQPRMRNQDGFLDWLGMSTDFSTWDVAVTHSQMGPTNPPMIPTAKGVQGGHARCPDWVFWPGTSWDWDFWDSGRFITIDRDWHRFSNANHKNRTMLGLWWQVVYNML
jgi:hypothetical protein